MRLLLIALSRLVDSVYLTFCCCCCGGIGTVVDGAGVGGAMFVCGIVYIVILLTLACTCYHYLVCSYFTHDETIMHVYVMFMLIAIILCLGIYNRF